VAVARNPRAKARGFFVVADAVRVVRKAGVGGTSANECLVDDGNAGLFRQS